MIRDLLIGCPVRSRQWIIKAWFLAVEEACEVAGIDNPAYMVVMADGDPTAEILAGIAERHGRRLHVIDAGERVDADQREWNHARYRHMTVLRNILLRGVRQLDPDAFLSLDSDVIVHEQLVANLAETLAAGRFDAVGGKTWMTGARDSCSYLHLINANGFLIRPDVSTVIPVDVIMAIKLMGRAAYGVDYRFDCFGEDVGWSRAAAEAGLRIGFDGRVGSKHVFAPADLERVDTRVGF